MSKKSKKAGAGASAPPTPPRSTRKQAQSSAEMAGERPSASEPSLPDEQMDDPTGRNRPGPVREPEQPKESDKIHAGSSGGAKDFVAGPQSAPEPEDFVAGPQSSEVEDLVGPQEDAPRAGGPAREQAAAKETGRRTDPEPESGQQHSRNGPETGRIDDLTSSFAGGLNEMQDMFTRFFGRYADLRTATDEAQRVSQAAQSACVDGFCAMTEEVHALTRETLDNQREATQAIFTAKSLPEAWEAQYRAMQEAMCCYAEHMRKLNAIGLETLQRAAEPVGEQMTTSFSRFWRQQAL